MEYDDLRILEAVARHGSMNRAAAELNTVQSNVTGRIRALEARLGVAVFTRSSRGVVLTGAGARLLPYAARLRALIEEATEAARDDGEPRGHLRVGALETTAALRLPPLLAAFAQAWPAVTLAVVSGTTAGLTADVLARTLDVAFVAGPVDHPELANETIFTEELVLLTAPGAERPDAAALGHSRVPPRIVVFRAGCSYRDRLQALLARSGVHSAAMLEFGSLEAILGCVSAGIGVTLLPRAVALPAVREGRVRVHELSRDEARVQTVVIHHRDRHVGSGLAAFLATVRPRPVPRIVARGGGPAIAASDSASHD